jgi:hypothetical protein
MGPTETVLTPEQQRIVLQALQEIHSLGHPWSRERAEKALTDIGVSIDKPTSNNPFL